MELDPSSGKLSGKLDLAPQAGDEKRFEFTVVCEAQTDDTQGKSKTDTRRFSLVLHRNVPIDTRPLRISTEAVLPDAYRHQPYPFAFAAEGGQAPYTWSATGQLPPGLKLTEDGKLQGKPSEAQTYTFRVTVATPQAESQTGTFTLSVSEKYPPHPPTPPLEIKTRSVPDARAEQSYSLALAAEGGIPPYKWTRSDGSPGAGMTLTSNGSLQGSPERPGAFAFSVTVSDVKGQTARAQLSLRVLPPLKPVTVRTKQAASGQVGRPYDLALAAVGGFPPYHWRPVGGNLPPGLALDEDSGRITGTPKEAGLWTVEVTVADAEGQAADQSLKLPVEVLTPTGVRKLVVTTRSLPTLAHGEPAEIVLACEGGTGPYQWRVANGLPAGLEMDGPKLVGTPASAGQHELELSVTDASGQLADVRLQLTVKRLVPSWLAVVLGGLLAAAAVAIAWLLRSYVRRGPVPLRITTESLPNARASCEYEVQLACEGGVCPYRWRVVEGHLPPGMELTPEGKIRGRPFEGISVDSTKEVTFSVEVEDGTGTRIRRRL